MLSFNTLFFLSKMLLRKKVSNWNIQNSKKSGIPPFYRISSPHCCRKSYIPSHFLPILENVIPLLIRRCSCWKMFFPQKLQQTPKFTIFQLQNVLVYLIESEFHVTLNEILGEKSGVCNVVIVAKFRFAEVNIQFNCKEICFN